MYKEATLNPTNLRDRAVDWESDVIQIFRTHTEQKEFSGERDTPSGRALFLAKPIVAGGPCLECHNTWRQAPVALVRIYGKNNGFDWKNGRHGRCADHPCPDVGAIGHRGSRFSQPDFRS
jgi:hypothetical protein